MRMPDADKDTVNWAIVKNSHNTFGKLFANTDIKKLLKCSLFDLVMQ